MAEAMTYSSLITDIQRYLERGEATDPDVYAQIPRFIMMAENRLAVELKSLASIRYVTTTLQNGDATLIKPERWRDTVSISYTDAVGDRKYVQQRSYEYLRSYWPNATLTDANPIYYSDYDYNHFLFAPTPNSNLPVELAYYEKVQPLDLSNQTNWFTEYAPQILLYASLYEIMIFLKDDDRVAVIQGYLDRALQTLVMEDSGRGTDRSQNAKGT